MANVSSRESVVEIRGLIVTRTFPEGKMRYLLCLLPSVLALVNSETVNQFTDLLESEFAALYLTYGNYSHSDYLKDSSDVKNDTYGSYVSYDNEYDYSDSSLPESVDWRKSAVTRIKNQGKCGSCWAFSATGAIEGQAALKLHKHIELSEQQLVDCVYSGQGHSGCDGGLMDDAFMYIERAGGIESEHDYPYTSQGGRAGTCRFERSASQIKVLGYSNVGDNEEALRNAVATIGPISVGIDAFGLHTYSHGIYDDPNCGHKLNHAVLVVGYGIANGIPYWLVKNSWGPSWGEAGYVRMRRNRNNQCGIASEAIYPRLL
ncbi:hypothetical protein GE061_012173 [Apolygus lucorum]|uniref:Peptidase C1A papain C-terminal domain-containing protein n=1 Tax=Apolygus lucorum TaxID=248454 RepID=A0A8S9XRL5_APOLU|nr:hypothetical protein GE061_012173 [Apolygus lucorum]